MSILGRIKGDTRSLDYSSHVLSKLEAEMVKVQNFGRFSVYRCFGEALNLKP